VADHALPHRDCDQAWPISHKYFILKGKLAAMFGRAVMKR